MGQAEKERVVVIGGIEGLGLSTFSWEFFQGGVCVAMEGKVE